MSANKPHADSFVLPSTDVLGIFRCGICWSLVKVVQVAVGEDEVIVRILCPTCGNIGEWQVKYGS